MCSHLSNWFLWLRSKSLECVENTAKSTDSLHTLHLTACFRCHSALLWISNQFWPDKYFTMTSQNLLLRGGGVWGVVVRGSVVRFGWEKMTGGNVGSSRWDCFKLHIFLSVNQQQESTLLHLKVSSSQTHDKQLLCRLVSVAGFNFEEAPWVTGASFG